MRRPGGPLQERLLGCLACLLVACVVGGAASLAGAAPSGAAAPAVPAIATDVVSAGGGTSTSVAPAAIKLSDTFGQGPIGPEATGTTVRLLDGFWATVSAVGQAARDTTPPAAANPFEAVAGDTTITLSWTNPSDTDFAGTLVIYKTTGYPTGPTDGTPVPNGGGGRFYNSPGSVGGFVHTHLVNGLTYYYCAYAFDAVSNYAIGADAAATPLDTIPPTAVTAFTATAGDTTVVLRWTNPADPDFDHVLIRFDTHQAPTSVTQGSPVPNGNNGTFPNAPASVDSFIHTHLTNGVTYYYSIWCADEVPNYSGYWDANATPRDTIPPALVDYFTATAGEKQVTLKWKNPPDADLKEVSIRYSTVSTPQTPTQGSPVENGANGIFTAVPAAVDSFVHTHLVPDVAYYYSIITLDEAGNYLSYTPAFAMPYDNTPPVVTVSVFQNPYITNHLDIQLVASEAVFDSSVVLMVGATELPVEQSDSERYVWRADYDICCTDTLTITGCARNISNLYGCSDPHEFSAALVLAASGGIAQSSDGQFGLKADGGAVARDAYLLVSESPGALPGALPVFSVSPPALALSGFVEIGIAYPDTTTMPGHFWVARFDGDHGTPIDSYLDRGQGKVLAYVRELGSYGLVWRPDATTPVYGEGAFRVMQNVPNPFVGSTTIAFEAAARGRVTIDILGVDGRAVRTLFDDAVTPGKHSIDWNGCDNAGRPVASGVYWCKARFGSETVTHKMIHMR